VAFHRSTAKAAREYQAAALAKWWRTPIGRALSEVLGDPYVVNRSTTEERARLLERPDVVEAIGKHVLAEMRAGRLAQPQ
jgi:hypothetical protein